MKNIWVLIFCLSFFCVLGQKNATHVVVKGETLYAIAKKYQITPEDIIKNNPDAVNGIKENQTLLIPSKNGLPSTIVTTANDTTYVVQKGETLYAISKRFGISVDTILAKNPSIKDTLSEGVQLVLPTKKSALPLDLSSEKNVDLLASANKSKQRNLVLLMPFNINRIENDSTKTKTEYLKTDKFLNITLDFYAGALQAIDSAKTLGLPISVKVYDAESSKYSSNVAAIIKNNDFSNVDAVIGPFTNAFVETAGQLLESYNVPIISPLMKETGKGGANVFYAMPSEEMQREASFTYMYSKSDVIFAIHATGKTPLSTYIKTNQKEVIQYYFNDKGVFDFTSFKAQLKKGKKNFVILDSDKIMQVLSVVNNLVKFKKEFDIQLVIFDHTDALDFEDVKVKNLAYLKMLYPSALRENESIEANYFATSFRKENKIAPNQYATRGFDVTFDTILRMCQEEGFINSAQTQVSEQIESKFKYVNNANTAVYMMYYNDDLTIKQAQ
ncbi:LysM peptidoglycan-binding domain-containing protein [Flavobacterium sp. 20NA77.7]|uniref:LysM peptidoglycan-binding domain-containing protein n=1 Tax=Flavobacterium nakdongensis TaxID=3073563 RepID=A0ABY9RC16_9FLAO|nr:LysM peptidoglycan-binding domain-containing protein [Flavobacterium sp. 20NA77.7]WMW78689.1 LysM peptidoglycan-binding domain-containing protein [Flavobacterium sp. 20NA77.7]